MKHLVHVMVSLAVIISTFGLSTPAPAQQSQDVPTLFGLSGGGFGEYVPEFNRATGSAPAFVGVFYRLEDQWPNGWAPAQLDEITALGGVPLIEITTTDFDGFTEADPPSLHRMAETLADWAKESPANRLMIAPFPEANLPEHPWGGDRAAFLDAYERVVEAFRAQGLGSDDVRFLLALNGGIGGDLTYEDYYPGSDVVDIVGFSKLNRAAPWRDYEESFGRHVREIQQELGSHVPILAFQTGSVQEGGDRDTWLTEMFTGLLAEEQVIGAVYFNRDKFEAGKDNDYRIVANGEVDSVVLDRLPSWSDPSEAGWIFDGRMDAWVAARLASAGFTDTAGSVFRSDIDWLANEGITRGCNPPTNTRFCPNDPVTRGQMAAFLVRALELNGRSLSFTDDDDSVFEHDIERLAHAGITRGCNPPTNTRFCPDGPVTRSQMAAFLVRALDLTARGSVDFTDDEGSVFEPDIERLAAAGITRGCNPPTNTRFCPGDPVTRGQMAAFLRRALG